MDTYVCDFSHLISVKKLNEFIPEDFSLEQNYPNPFNPVTMIKFSLPSISKGTAPVRLIVFDILGREVAVLVNEQLAAGSFEVGWDGTNYPSGVYSYRLSINNQQLAARKMVLIR